jgi:hypothetical protein
MPIRSEAWWITIGKSSLVQVFVQKIAQLRLRPNQMDPNGQLAAG